MAEADMLEILADKLESLPHRIYSFERPPEMTDQELESKLEARLQRLESTELNGSTCGEVIDTIVQFVEAKTHDAVFLEPNDLTDRIKNAVVDLLDSLDPQLPVSTLVWVLGRINAPEMEGRLLGWLAHYRNEAQKYHAGIHNALIVLDRLNAKHRDASIDEVEENLRRVEEYLDRNRGKSDL